VVDFGGDDSGVDRGGIHYHDGGSWNYLAAWDDVNHMLDWRDDLVADFGQCRGVFYHDGNTWDLLTSWDDINRMLVWDGDLVADFGKGRQMFKNDGLGWNHLAAWDDTAEMIIWHDWTNENLTADFGAGKGVWYHDDGLSWTWTTDWSTAD